MRSSTCRQPWLTSLRRLPGVLGILILLLDQGTKALVMVRMPVEQSPRITVIPGFFDLVHFRNPGAAWGIMSSQTLLLAGLSAVVLIGLILAFDHLSEGFPERALALGALAGGIAGNLVDRVLYREVVDFLLFYWRSFHWPAFNVADSAISCGVAVFVVSSFLRSRSSTETGTGAVGAGTGNQTNA